MQGILLNVDEANIADIFVTIIIVNSTIIIISQ